MFALMFAQTSPDLPAQLFDAIRRGDEAQVRAILAADANLGHARNQEGATAVLWALYTRHPELAPLVLGARQPDFFEACALGRRDRVEALLRDNPKLAATDAPDGFSGLGLAIFFGHLQTARLLVEAGADVDRPSRNSFRVTPLHSAVASGNVELVELLLAHGARPDPEEFLGATPLHSAAAAGNREIVRRLLAAGADRNRQVKEGKTPAGLARENGHAELADELK
jgi:uncharacterized protein